MRIYFAADNQAESRLQQRFSHVVDVLNSAGVLVMSNLAQRNLSSFSGQDLEKISQSGEILIEKVDGLIIEETKPLAESGYLIAIALAYKKPILYLIEEDKPINKNLLHLQTDKQAAKLLHLEHYTAGSLEKELIDFLQAIEQPGGREFPSIKFTLRITSRIERYLQWKTNNTKLSKADYLRNVIEDIIAHDEGYQRFISRQEEE